MFCLFLSFRHTPGPASISESALAELEQFLRTITGLREFRIHRPASAEDPMLDDGAPPSLVLQLFFAAIEAIETAALPGGELHNLPDQAAIAALEPYEADHQAMLTRNYPVPESKPNGPPGIQCTYLVRYEGPAQDTNQWLSDYLTGHPPLMTQLPGIRKLEVFTRVDWCGSLPWPRANDLQRNLVVFDNPAALTGALNNPLRIQMREHYNALPPFSGAVTHYPMSTRQAHLARN